MTPVQASKRHEIGIKSLQKLVEKNGRGNWVEN
jgi:hypothetical protein